MPQHVIIVQKPADRSWAEKMGTVATARDYITGTEKFGTRQTRVINLSDEFDYLDLGYYCSLLAEARGHNVIPTVETILDGAPATPFLAFGDTVRIEMKDAAGHSIFGAIEQTVTKYERA